MFHSSVFVLFCLSWCRLSGVFADSLSVTEGESIILKTHIAKISEDEDLLWKYGAKKSLIAEISRAAEIFSTYNGTDGRFRDRLKLDHQTGSLTITNISTEHAGDYEVVISGAKRSSKTFRVSVYAPLPTPIITRNSSQCSSSSSPSRQNCLLVCSVLNASHATLSWYKRISLLSSINVSHHNRSLSLEVKFADKNPYSCVVSNPISNQTQHLNITRLCHTCPDQGLPLLYIVLISAGSLLVVAVVGMCCICRKCRKTVETQEEDRTDSALCKPRTRQKKPKTDSVYENVPKKRSDRK
ncbi:SLAM family member 9-like [Pseudorasbora parva]|uniref:SLAM family member 9-like n=1 Tax=Pseudorasbora parva TaxID=51549 RepID=UPI00351E5F60